MYLLTFYIIFLTLGTSQKLFRKLEDELSKDKELIQRQEHVISDLHMKVDDLEGARHKASSEKYRYREESDKVSCKVSNITSITSGLCGVLLPESNT